MSIEITKAEGRYEVHVDGVLAGFTEFREEEGALAFPHTVIETAFEGQGLASKLVGGALDDVRSQGRQIRPYCPYVRGWIAKHPEYRDLVDDPDRFKL